jgi:dTDP-4-amino-4,6-dideoxygalactose transaminase
MNLENRLSKIHGIPYVSLTGNGTTAIHLILKALGIENQKVAIPNNVCMNVPIAIYLSGNEPLYLDIEMETLGIDPRELEKYIDEVAVVIAVHNYGNLCKIEEISEICKDVFLIEDFAIAQGLENVGSWGDASIVSFGSGKVIDVGNGGAVFSRDRNLIEEISKIELSNSFKEEELELFSKTHTKLYNIDFGKSLGEHRNYFQSFLKNGAKNFLYKFDKNLIPKISEELLKLDSKVQNRISNAKYIFEKLENSGIVLQNPEMVSTFWRYNIFLENRDDVFQRILKKRYKISSWYHSVDILFQKRNREFLNSDKVSDTILNIWTNEDIDKSYIDNITKEIKE